MTGERNLLQTKRFAFSIRVSKLYRYLCMEKKEFILSKQLLRSGTSIGAMIRESEFSESKLDFIHKLAIAQKENNETLYLLELLYEEQFFSKEAFNSIHNDGLELIKIITASIKTAKQHINN